MRGAKPADHGAGSRRAAAHRVPQAVEVAAVAVGGQHFLDELLARRADRTASSKSMMYFLVPARRRHHRGRPGRPRAPALTAAPVTPRSTQTVADRPHDR